MFLFFSLRKDYDWITNILNFSIKFYFWTLWLLCVKYFQDQGPDHTFAGALKNVIFLSQSKKSFASIYENE